MKVDNFAPEMIEAFRVAAQRSFSIILPTRAQAIYVRHRFYRLRQAMRREKHPMLSVAEGIVIRDPVPVPVNGQMSYSLVFDKQDSNLIHLLADAGVKISYDENYLTEDKRDPSIDIIPSEVDEVGSASNEALQRFLKRN